MILFSFHLINGWWTLCLLCRFGVSFTYYGITLNISGFSLDPYVTQFMFGAIEIPAKVCVYFVLDRIGRRHCQAWTLIVTGFFIALNACIPAGGKFTLHFCSLNRHNFICCSICFSGEGRREIINANLNRNEVLQPVIHLQIINRTGTGIIWLQD